MDVFRVRIPMVGTIRALVSLQLSAIARVPPHGRFLPLFAAMRARYSVRKGATTVLRSICASRRVV